MSESLCSFAVFGALWIGRYWGQGWGGVRGSKLENFLWLREVILCKLTPSRYVKHPIPASFQALDIWYLILAGKPSPDVLAGQGLPWPFS